MGRKLHGKFLMGKERCGPAKQIRFASKLRGERKRVGGDEDERGGSGEGGRCGMSICW